MNQKIFYKDDIKIITKFLCLLGHPAFEVNQVMGIVFENKQGFFFKQTTFFKANKIVRER